jgi:hypothetical protein
MHSNPASKGYKKFYILCSILFPLLQSTFFPILICKRLEMLKHGNAFSSRNMEPCQQLHGAKTSLLNMCTEKQMSYYNQPTKNARIPEEWVLQILMGDIVLVDSRYLPIENSASIKFLLSALSSSACIT